MGVSTKVFGVATGAIAALSIAASSQAAVILFSGSGSSGTVLGMPFLEDGEATISWGIPGVNAGDTPSTFGDPVTSFELIFSGGGSINVASIAIGNGAGCAGSAGGGTTFCTNATDVPWTATLVSPDSILFTAKAGNDLQPGQDFFVNVFFNGSAPTEFVGAATTTPEPSTWALMLTGFAGLGGALRRRQRLAAAI